MKPILGVAALLAWFAQCPDYIPHGHHHPGHPHDPGEPHEPSCPDAGEETPDAGEDAAVTPDAGGGTPDAGGVTPDAAVGGGPDASIGEMPDASGGEVPDAMVEEPDASGQQSIDAGPVMNAMKPLEELPTSFTCDSPGFGLYKTAACEEGVLGDTVRAYKPRYPLWSDGAEKTRAIYLPPGATINVQDKDRWEFPKGTRLFKTFKVEGRRVETRVIEKKLLTPGFESWTFVAYEWGEDGRTLTKVDKDKGHPDAYRDHDIPTAMECKQCHNQANMDATMTRDAVNGFSAIQLNYVGAGYELEELLNTNKLVNATGGPVLTEAEAEIPGTEAQKKAFGYLHANCGNCHGGPTPSRGFAIWATVGLSNVNDLPVVKNGCGKCLTGWIGKENADLKFKYYYRIEAGSGITSGIIGRMSAHLANDPTKLDKANKMPKIGTEFLDFDAITSVAQVIDGLDSSVCAPAELASSCKQPAPMPPAMP
jgi:hypothetical protein